MKPVFRVKAFVCGVLMLCTALGSAALTLGRAQGAVFVGKPLDLRVLVQFDSTEDMQAACMNAEVFYGDTRLESSKVAVAVEPSSSSGSLGPTVRVMSSVLVNEPVVTVNFRVGCQQKLSKRYTIFPVSWRPLYRGPNVKARRRKSVCRWFPPHRHALRQRPHVSAWPRVPCQSPCGSPPKWLQRDRQRQRHRRERLLDPSQRLKPVVSPA